MGCKQSKSAEAVTETPSVVDKAEDTAKPAEDAKEEAPQAADVAGKPAENENKAKAVEGGESEKPKPQIFAIMRNGHEVIRGAQEDVEALIAKGDVDEAKNMWEKMHKWCDVHMAMEEGSGSSDKSPIGMFKLLDKNFDNIAKEKGLYKDHKDLNKKEEAVDAAFKEGDAEKIKATFDEFAAANSVHLKKEESIMMPKIKEFKEGGHPMKKYMQQEVLACVKKEDMEFFIKFANEMLEKHAGDQPKVRVFNHALYAAATPEQWTEWDAWIKEVLSEKTYEAVQAAING